MLNLMFFSALNCQYSAWNWQKCTRTCGDGGTQSGTRTIIQQPINGGQECSGDLTSSRPCNSDPCPDPGKFIQYLFEDCLLEKDSTSKRSSKLNYELSASHIYIHSTKMHFSVDGKWELKPWSECSKKCGPGGTRSRSTECIAPLHGGLPCPAEGETTQTEDCHIGDCPSTCATGKKWHLNVLGTLPPTLFYWQTFVTHWLLTLG